MPTTQTQECNWETPGGPLKDTYHENPSQNQQGHFLHDHSTPSDFFALLSIFLLIKTSVCPEMLIWVLEREPLIRDQHLNISPSFPPTPVSQVWLLLWLNQDSAACLKPGLAAGLRGQHYLIPSLDRYITRKEDIDQYLS